MKTIKKLAAFLLSLLLAFSFTAVVASADSTAYLTFSKSGSAYVVDKCSSAASGVITVPATYNGLPVKKIADNAFQNCSAITQLVIPDSVTTIGKFAFADCGSLRTVSMNASTCSFGASAFSGCDNLETVNLPSGVTAISQEMFKSCTALSEIYLPSTVVAIGKEAFMNTGLTRVTIPASVSVISQNSFMSCPNVQKFTVESGNSAFKSVDDCLYSADGKTLIQYPAGRASSSYTVPSTVTAIGDGAFSTARNLTRIVFPASLKVIGPYAFYDCSALTSVNIPEGVTSIGSMAFNGCSSLKNVTVPSTVTSFENAFCGSGVKNVVLADGLTSISPKAFYGCESLTGITVPDSVTTIGIGAFDGCSSLASVAIPASVTSIGSGAFKDCAEINLIVESGSAAHDYAVANSIDFTFSSDVTPAKTVSSVSVKTLPSKRTYTVGQPLNTSGLVLKVNYSDGSSAEITSGFTASADLTTAGTKTVTVTYGGKAATYTVTVTSSAEDGEKTAISIEVAKLPNKTEYNYRDAVDITGLTIKVNYSDGTSEEITSGFITDAPSQLKPVGDRLITVKYGDLNTTFTVTSSYAWWQWIIRILLLGFLWY